MAPCKKLYFLSGPIGIEYFFDIKKEREIMDELYSGNDEQISKFICNIPYYKAAQH